MHVYGRHVLEVRHYIWIDVNHSHTRVIGEYMPTTVLAEFAIRVLGFAEAADVFIIFCDRNVVQWPQAERINRCRGLGSAILTMAIPHNFWLAGDLKLDCPTKTLSFEYFTHVAVPI